MRWSWVPSNRSSEPSSARAAASSASSSGASGRVTLDCLGEPGCGALALCRRSGSRRESAAEGGEEVAMELAGTAAQLARLRGEAVELCHRSAEGGGQRRDRGLPADGRPLDMGVRGGEGRDGPIAPILDRPHESRGALRAHARQPGEQLLLGMGPRPQPPVELEHHDAVDDDRGVRLVRLERSAVAPGNISRRAGAPARPRRRRVLPRPSRRSRPAARARSRPGRSLGGFDGSRRPHPRRDRVFGRAAVRVLGRQDHEEAPVDVGDVQPVDEPEGDELAALPVVPPGVLEAGTESRHESSCRGDGALTSPCGSRSFAPHARPPEIAGRGQYRRDRRKHAAREPLRHHCLLSRGGLRPDEQLRRDRPGPARARASGRVRRRRVVRGQPRGPGLRGATDAARSGARGAGGARSVLEGLHPRDRARLPHADDRAARVVRRTDVPRPAATGPPTSTTACGRSSTSCSPRSSSRTTSSASPRIHASGHAWARIVSCNPLEIQDPGIPPVFSGYPVERPRRLGRVPRHLPACSRRAPRRVLGALRRARSSTVARGRLHPRFRSAQPLRVPRGDRLRARPAARAVVASPRLLCPRRRGDVRAPGAARRRARGSSSISRSGAWARQTST